LNTLLRAAENNLPVNTFKRILGVQLLLYVVQFSTKS
jgi:hypothetical protein